MNLICLKVKYCGEATIIINYGAIYVYKFIAFNINVHTNVSKIVVLQAKLKKR